MDDARIPDVPSHPLIMGRTAFYEWAATQSTGRYERVNGEVVKMSPEVWQHALLKAQIFRALEDALEGLPSYEAAPDGMTVEVDADTNFEPDASIHFGEPIAPRSRSIPNPVVVIEVLSPSTRRIDTTIKAEAYLRTASIVHYLIFRADRREVTLLSRGNDKRLIFLRGALIQLDPPGIALDVDAIYARARVS